MSTVITREHLSSEAPASRTDPVGAAAGPAFGGIANVLLRTQDSFTPTILRGTLGLVMFPHGAQKLFGWFGGFGFSGTFGFLTGTMHLPAVVAVLVILFESVGAVALLLGSFTRGAAAGVLAVMLGAIATVHAPNGFFMNWAGTQKGEGFEYHLLAIGIALALMLLGGGRWSVDRVLVGVTRRAS